MHDVSSNGGITHRYHQNVHVSATDVFRLVVGSWTMAEMISSAGSGWLRRRSNRRDHPHSAPQRRTHRLRLEQLEERALFTVPFSFFDDHTMALQANNPPGFSEPAIPMFHNSKPVGDQRYQVVEAFDQVPGTSKFPLTFDDLAANTFVAQRIRSRMARPAHLALRLSVRRRCARRMADFVTSRRSLAPTSPPELLCVTKAW